MKRIHRNLSKIVVRKKYLFISLVFAITIFSSCELDHTTDVKVKDPINYQTVDVSFSIDLPISQQEIDALSFGTIVSSGHPVSKNFKATLFKDAYNLVTLTKQDSLFAFIWIEPTLSQNYTINSDLITKSLISVLSDFLDPGYGSVQNAFNIAPSLPNYNNVKNLLNTSWHNKGLTSLLNNLQFKNALKSIVIDLSPDTNVVDLYSQKRIFTTDNPFSDNVTICYITYPTVKESGFDVGATFDGRYASVTVQNNKRRGVDGYIYKNHTQYVDKIIFGGKVQSGIISGLISEALASSKKEFALDFVNMGFNDSYEIQLVGPAWEFPWVTDNRYTVPWIRTIILNQLLPIATFLFDLKFKAVGPFMEIMKEFYDWLSIGVDWVVIQDQFKNRQSNNPTFWIDVGITSVTHLYNVLSKPDLIKYLGAAIFGFRGAALESWTKRVSDNIGKIANWLNFLNSLVEEVRVFQDYFQTAYRTDYFFLKVSSGQGDMQGNWQGLRQDAWQQFYIVDCPTPTTLNFHNWTYASWGFCELTGNGTYNPQNLTGTFVDGTFLRNEGGWCKTNDNYYLTNNKTHLIGTFVIQPGQPYPCNYSGQPGNFTLDKK